MSEIAKEYIEELETKRRDLLQRRANILASIGQLEGQRDMLTLDIARLEGGIEVAQMFFNTNGSSSRET